MGETFYSILGVTADADADQIRSAYRERVKESHPDLNDGGDSPRDFKRLTTARDVLLDADERSTYDRLGHTTYVSRHVETTVWQADGESGGEGRTTSERGSRRRRHSRSSWADSSSRRQSGSKTTSSGSATNRSASGTTSSGSATTGSGSSSTRSGSASTNSGSTTTGQWGSSRSSAADSGTTHTAETGGRSRSRASAGPRNEPWQRAPNAYRSNSSYVADESQSYWRAVVGGIQQLGLWFVVHLILIISALVTGVLLLSSVSADPAISAAAVLFLAILIGVVVAVSVLHVLLELY